MAKQNGNKGAGNKNTQTDNGKTPIKNDNGENTHASMIDLRMAGIVPSSMNVLAYNLPDGRYGAGYMHYYPKTDEETGITPKQGNKVLVVTNDNDEVVESIHDWVRSNSKGNHFTVGWLEGPKCHVVKEVIIDRVIYVKNKRVIETKLFPKQQI